jgi:protocatechuate 3,4-dioxygenase beta subunit
MNNRRDFLKTAGLAGVSTLIPFGSIFAGNGSNSPQSCVLIPSETAGPYPLDLTANQAFFRQDIREDRSGVQLNLRMKIFGLANCAPMQNVRVNIWHCDKDGNYSGYDTQVGKTYLRGYQITDANGEVEFVTIFPGWYNGRICHIHFQVYVSSQYAAVSQLTFDLAAKNAVYAANPSIYTKGADPLTFNQDNIFSDGYQYQLATLEADPETGGYRSYMEVSVQGSGTMGVGHIEKENAKQFILEQNYPNPFTTDTTIPFSLYQTSDVIIELFDLEGRRVAVLTEAKYGAGDYSIPVHMNRLGLASSNYVYQIQVTNADGTFRQCNLMTSAR